MEKIPLTLLKDDPEMRATLELTRGVKDKLNQERDFLIQAIKEFDKKASEMVRTAWKPVEDLCYKRGYFKAGDFKDESDGRPHLNWDRANGVLYWEKQDSSENEGLNAAIASALLAALEGKEPLAIKIEKISKKGEPSNESH